MLFSSLHRILKKPVLGAILLALATLLAFQNCGDVKWSRTEEIDLSLLVDVPSTDVDIDVGVDSDVVVPNANPALDSDCQTGKQTVTLDLNFASTVQPAPLPVDPAQMYCQFGLGENLAPVNDFLTARKVQTQALNLPANAKICALRVNVPQQNFFPDDSFVLTFKNVPLMTNISFLPTPLATSSEHFVLNWAERRGTPVILDFFLNDHRFDYCLGLPQAMCVLPNNIPANLQMPVALSGVLLNQIDAKTPGVERQFQLNVFGDDDATDCQHNGFTATVQVDYVLK